MLFKVGAWLLSFLSGGTVGRILDTLDRRADAQTEREKVRKEVTIEAIRAEVAAQQSGRDILIAEQGRWYTAAIRPLLALPVIIFFWKVIVWDKVLGWGSTDPLTGAAAEWAGAIVTTYVGGRTVEKVASTISARWGR
jgi:hypothetical protein